MTAPMPAPALDRDDGDPTLDLIRWAKTARHRVVKTEHTTYPLTPDGDYRAWLDGLSTRIADDEKDARAAARRRRR